MTWWPEKTKITNIGNPTSKASLAIDAQTQGFNLAIDLCRTAYEKEVAEGRICENVPSIKEIVSEMEAWSSNMNGYKHQAGLMLANEDFEICARDILARLKGKK